MLQMKFFLQFTNMDLDMDVHYTYLDVPNDCISWICVATLSYRAYYNVLKSQYETKPLVLPLLYLLSFFCIFLRSK